MTSHELAAVRDRTVQWFDDLFPIGGRTPVHIGDEAQTQRAVHWAPSEVRATRVVIDLHAHARIPVRRSRSREDDVLQTHVVDGRATIWPALGVAHDRPTRALVSHLGASSVVAVMPEASRRDLGPIGSGVRVGELPTGTLTFLFTVIESSARLWEGHPEAMRDALASHDALVREAIEGHGGFVVKTTGDGCMAAFPTADAGVSAAVAAPRALEAATWGATGTLRVRMGLTQGWRRCVTGTTSVQR